MKQVTSVNLIPLCILRYIRDGHSENATLGFGMVDVATRRFSETSESLNARS